MKLDILAFGAHPDDVELSCSGTLLSHIAQGKTVGLIDLTRGELGSRGTADIRDQEAADSARLMGAKVRENLNLGDGTFEHSNENIRKIIQIIRKYQPEIVLANALKDRHPDHGRGAKLVSDACYFSGLKKIETTPKANSGQPLSGNPQTPWRPKAVYHYIQDYNLEPDFVVDISSFLEKKFECILAFKSQFYLPSDKEYAAEAQTPISGKDFMDFIKAKGAVFGRHAGFDYAEGFNVARTPGIENLFTLR